jgi:cytochrome bd-type quinol oxidase subunit 2
MSTGREIRARSPIMCWALAVITSGLYSVYWTWRIGNELNEYEGKEIFNVKRWRELFLILHAGVVVTLVWAVRDDRLAPIFLVLVAGLFGFYIYVHVSIGNYIKDRNRSLGVRDAYSNAVFLFLFWVIANTGIIYLQSALNRVVANGQLGA